MNKYSPIIIVLLLIIAGLLGYSTFSESQADWRNAQKLSRDQRRINDIKMLRDALFFYNKDTGSYPEGRVVFGKDNVNALTSSGFTIFPQQAETAYIKPLPVDPLGLDPYTYTAYTNESSDEFCKKTPCGYYTIDFVTEGHVDSFNPGSHVADPSGI